MSYPTQGDGAAEISGSSALGDTFYPLYRYLFSDTSQFVANVEEKLAQARMADNVEMFLSRALAVGVLSGFALWLVGTILGFVLFTTVFSGTSITFLGLNLSPGLASVLNALKLPFLIFVAGLVFGAIGFATGFGSLVSIPYFRASEREREINVLLADSIAFMYALSVGGLNQLEILQAMARADDTYGEAAKEFQSIVLETEYFDTDYRTAVRNQAIETPSNELSQFLTDMLSIINSGGDMTDFLEDQKDMHLRTAKQEQQKMLDTLELFGEMYMTLSLFPLLLLIILVVMSLMNGMQTMLLYGTVYALIPLIGVAFLVMVSTVTQDTVGDGYLRPEGDEELVVDEGMGILNLDLVDRFTGEYGIFDKIRRNEGTYELLQIVLKPHLFFRDHPLYVLALTIPVTLVVWVVAFVFGYIPLSIEAMKQNPVRGTFFVAYVPIYLNFLPLTIFYEWNLRSRKAILNNLSANLRKLASANDTGMTLLESIKVVSDTSAGKLSDEFEIMHSKVNYGTSLKNALREFNNKYHIPRLARTVKLISEAQEASNQIQNVLSTAARASENQDDIERDRVARTRMQVVIIIMTYLTLLGVMAMLEQQFLGKIADLVAEQSSSGGGAGGAGGAGGLTGGGGLDVPLLRMLFFHAVVMQAVLSSFVAGYIRTVKLMAGLKFAVVLSTIALVTWMAIS